MRSWIKDRLFDRSDGSIFLVLLLTYAFSMLISYFTLITERSYIRIWLNDVIGLLDVAYRVQQGQIPYNDFHFSYGPLVAFVPALGLEFGLKGGVIFGFDSVVVCGFVLLAATVAVSRRITLPAALVVFVFVWLLIAAPLADSENFGGITWGTFYNRHGWAALIVVLLFYVEPEFVRPRDKWIDAAALSVLVLFEIYTKISFGAVALAFVIANSFVSKYNRRVSICSLALIVLVVAFLEVAFHFHLAYWHDIVETVSRVGAGEPHTAVLRLLNNAPIILASFGALLAARATGRSSAFDALFVLGCIIANMLLRSSVGANSAGPLVAQVSVFICLGELARRTEVKRLASSAAPFQWEHHLASLGCLFLALIFVSTETGSRILAWGYYFEKVVLADGREMVPGTPPSLTSFLVYKDNKPNLFDLTADGTLSRYRAAGAIELTAEDYMKTIIEGTDLLQSIDYHGRTVFTFDLVNPFPYALNMRPIRNGYPQFWLGKEWTADPKLLPKPEVLVGAADFVMVPRLPYSVSQFTIMKNIYGTYLKQNYVQLTESPHWELWTRNLRQ
jgi:hypothetical protein